MNKRILMISALAFAVLLSVGSIAAQGTKTMQGGMSKDMAAMKNDPHHKLMMAYMKTMADFSRLLRDQALTPKGVDAEFAGAAVAQLRHDFDAMEALRQKHMDAMSPEKKAKMKMMMDKMDKGQTTVKEHVVALETAIQADTPDAKQVAMHANDLVKHFTMMSNMDKQMSMRKKAAAKTKMNMEMKPM